MMEKAGIVKVLGTAAISFFLISFLPSASATIDSNNDFSEAVEVKNNDVITESLDESDDLSDYFKILLEAGDVAEIIMAVPFDQDFNLLLYDESHTLLDSSLIDNPSTGQYYEVVAIEATSTGWYYVEAYVYAGAGAYQLFVYATAEWTVLVYLDADNDLESAAIEDFMEMSAVGSTDDVNIVVQFDRIDGYDSSYGDWTGCEMFLVTEGMTPEAVNSYYSVGEVNMGSPMTLVQFGNLAIEWFPAHHYALVLWDHGGSWSGVCWDDSETPESDSLSMAELNWALAEIVSENEIPPIDVVWFDACNMASIEVACEVWGSCSYMVASEMWEPDTGANYELTLSAMASNPQMTEAELCQQIVSDFVDSYDSTPESGYLEDDVTQSAVNLSEVYTLAPFVATLSSELLANISAYVNYIDLSWSEAECYDFGYELYVDLHDLALKLSQYLPPGAAKSYALDVMANVNASVVAEDHWDAPDGQSLVGAEGLTIYFPWEVFYDSSYESSGIGFPGSTDWDEMLHAFYSSVSLSNSPPSIVSYSPTGDQTMVEGEVRAFSVEAIDPDGNALSYSWYIDSGLIAEDSTSIEYSPDYGDVGPHSLKVDVWDGALTDSHTWSIEVEEVSTEAPDSYVIHPDTYWMVSAPLWVEAEATDESGMVTEVSLWCRYSSDNSTWSSWTEFEVDTESPWEWMFDFPSGNGYYEFYSIAVDDSSNQETAPVAADALCAYDGSPPEALFTVQPSVGDVLTAFVVNASTSSDFKDSVEFLEVRWDWENDGMWDTDWTTLKNASHLYDEPGDYVIKLEVRDTDGMVNTTTMMVSVVNVIPEFDSVVVPIMSMLLVVTVLWRRQRGR